MLFDYNKMHLKSSKAALGAAVVDDIFAVILLAIFSLAVQGGLLGSLDGIVIQEHGSSISWALISIIGSFVIMGIGGYYAMRPFM